MVFSLGVAGAGVDLASRNFILDLAPDEARRPVYIAMNDTLVALPTMLLVIGGAVIDRAGFSPVFIGIAVCSVAAAVLARNLRHRATTRARASPRKPTAEIPMPE